MIPFYLDINIIQRNYIKYRPISLMNICAKILRKLNPIMHKNYTLWPNDIYFEYEILG